MKMNLKVKVGVLAGILILGVVIGSREPDLNLSFVRNVPTVLSPERLDKNISTVARWPQWFFSLSQVHVIDSPRLKLASHTLSTSQGATSSELPADTTLIEKGSILQLKIDPHRFLSKPFDLTVEVTDYQPQKSLRLTVLDDSSGRLTRLFDHIEWQLDIEPQERGAMIHAQEKVHTKQLKSRFFGRVAERILMNQVFYPDILKLSELTQPYVVDEGPKTKGGFGTGSD